MKRKFSRETIEDTLRLLVPAGASKEEASFSGRYEKQYEIIQNILAGRDVLAILPTGGGKSVCYQVPALLLPGLTLVITPLVSLMQDQVNALRKRGVAVGCISGPFQFDGKTMHKGEGSRKIRNKIYLKAARGELKLLYVTPERLRTGAFIRMAERTDISLVAVDEAHCVSMWGYDFRPRYLEIHKIIRRCKKRPVVAAFTATATQDIKEDIRFLLKLKDPFEVSAASVVRENLRFSIERVKSEDDRRNKVIAFLWVHRMESGIVYFSSVRLLNDFYEWLEMVSQMGDLEFSVGRYYADLNREAGARAPVGGKSGVENREKNYEDFIAGRKKVLLATSAFGMGIDKDDVRYVLHYSMPPDLESYYQEAGRAGRDGLAAECILYYREGDEKICKALFEDEPKLLPGEQDNELRVKMRTLRLKEMVRHCKKSDQREEIREALEKYFSDYRPKISKEDRALEMQLMDQYLKQIEVLYANRTKIAGMLREGKLVGMDVPVGGGKSQLTVSYIVTGGTIDYFDMMLMDSIYTLEKNGAKSIHPKNILELLSGDEKITVRPERREEIMARIEKLRRMEITIDRRKSLGLGFVYDDELCPAIMGSFLPLRTQGKGYAWEEYPPLYRYAEMVNGQFYTIPVHFLQAKKSGKTLTATTTNMKLNYCIYLRLAMMGNYYKGGHRNITSRKIRYDHIFEKIGVTWPTDTRELHRKEKKMQERIHDYLEFLCYHPDIDLKSFRVYNGADGKPAGVEVNFPTRTFADLTGKGRLS